MWSWGSKPAIKPTARATPGRGVGVDGSQAAVAARASNDDGPDPKEIVQRRHGDWRDHEIMWRQLLDSYEGGNRYRNATYGPDRRMLPVRNLFRHRREYPDPQQFPNYLSGFPGAMGGVDGGAVGAMIGPLPGTLGADPGATAADDDYEGRRARTTPPGWLAEAVAIHLGKIFDQEVKRVGPPDLEAWWKDVDGRGTPIDDYMREVGAPLTLVPGTIDFCLDHPKAPPGEKVETRADELRLGLDKCVINYILPQNMVWWDCDAAGRFVECLVREYENPSWRNDRDQKGNEIDPEGDNDAAKAWRNNYVRFRHWTLTGSTLYNCDGDKVLDYTPHNFGAPPITREKGGLKHRTENVGQSVYEAAAGYMRDFYNIDSELTLANTIQAAALLSGPEDFCKGDSTLSVGAGNVIPMKRDPEKGTYQGWEYISPPPDCADSLRKEKQDRRDAFDRTLCLAKPAGTTSVSAGTNASTVSQSGHSKEMDAVTGNKFLTGLAKTLAKVERRLAETALWVIRGKRPTREEMEEVKITYPSRFELNSADEQLGNLTLLQKTLAASGSAPMTEATILQSIVRQVILGLDDEQYEVLDNEILLSVKANATIKDQIKESMMDGVSDNSEEYEGDGSTEQNAGNDPVGQSAATMVSMSTPVVE